MFESRVTIVQANLRRYLDGAAPAPRLISTRRVFLLCDIRSPTEAAAAARTVAWSRA